MRKERYIHIHILRSTYIYIGGVALRSCWNCCMYANKNKKHATFLFNFCFMRYISYSSRRFHPPPLPVRTPGVFVFFLLLLYICILARAVIRRDLTHSPLAVSTPPSSSWSIMQFPKCGCPPNRMTDVFIFTTLSNPPPSTNRPKTWGDKIHIQKNSWCKIKYGKNVQVHLKGSNAQMLVVWLY